MILPYHAELKSDGGQPDGGVGCQKYHCAMKNALLTIQSCLFVTSAPRACHLQVSGYVLPLAMPNSGRQVLFREASFPSFFFSSFLPTHTLIFLSNTVCLVCVTECQAKHFWTTFLFIRSLSGAFETNMK